MPSASSASAGACAGGGGTDSDSISAPFFPQTIPAAAGGTAFCLDPKGDVKTYGDHGKLSMDDVCTTAFDGECEIYKRFGLKRTVVIHYVDDAGKGSTIEAILSQFGSIGGAYAMYTKRVIADSDPIDPTAPRVVAGIDPSAAAALGTGRGYVWKNDQLVELQYNNENESPEQLASSSLPLLTALAKSLATKLPAGPIPAAVTALPADNRVANGVQYYTKDVMGLAGAGAGAVGYYKDATKRWRGFSIVSDSDSAAKDAFKVIRSRPGTLPVPTTSIGSPSIDEAAHVVLALSKESPKTEWLVVRRGVEIDALGDEEFALKAGAAPEELAKARLSKDDAVALMKSWTAKPAASAAPGTSAVSDAGASAATTTKPAGH
jgi:hypothetical protein